MAPTKRIIAASENIRFVLLPTDANYTISDTGVSELDFDHSHVDTFTLCITVLASVDSDVSPGFFTTSRDSQKTQEGKC